jgi:hypothetical protein
MSNYIIHIQYPGEVKGNDFTISKPTAERAAQSAIHKFLELHILDDKLADGGELVLRISRR